MTTSGKIEKWAGHSFGLEIDGIEINAISEVSGLKLEQDVITMDHRVPDGAVAARKLPGRWKAGEVTLTRGLTRDRSFERWMVDTQLGEPVRSSKNGTLTVYDDGDQPLTRYTLINAWPSKLEIGGLKAGDTGMAVEKLVISYERMELD